MDITRLLIEMFGLIHLYASTLQVMLWIIVLGVWYNSVVLAYEISNIESGLSEQFHQLHW